MNALGRPRATTLPTVAAFAAIYLIWGSTYLAIAVGVETIPPLLMIGVRCLVGGGILYALARLRGAPSPDVPTWRRAAIAGALLFGSGQGVLAWAEQRVPSGISALLIGTIPMFVVVLGWRGGVLAGGRPPARPGMGVVAGLLVGLVGVALTVAGTAGVSGADMLGVTALLLAAFSWAAGSLQAASGGDPWPDRRAATHLITGGLVLMLASLVTGEMGSFDLEAVRVRSLLALAYLAVFGTLVAFSAYVWLLSRIEPSTVASHAYVNPAVAVLLGATLGGETLTPRTLVGAGLIVVAVVVVVLGGRWGVERTAGHPHGAVETKRARSGRREVAPAASSC